ncbi:hypothetical protein L7F22_003468 [Adiantum nelumboides]|nr:hypothetical protein [Adiantum nelumboides]
MISTTKLVQQRPYPMNPKYAKIVQEELGKLIKCGFIYPIEHSEWVSPIFIVPKKNGKFRVCVDLKKVNAAIRRDHYPLPYSEHVLEKVASKDAYSFLDGYSGYDQITIALEDQAKTAFIIEFGVFAFRVMAFGLTNAPATFQQLINTAFKEYLREFCEAFLNDLYIYSFWEEHLSYLQKVFEKCRLYRISLNPFKCQFWVKHGVILGYIVSKNGISIDEGKIKVILELPPPTNYRLEGNKDWREVEDEQEEVLANKTVVDSTNGSVDSIAANVSKPRGDSSYFATLQKLFNVHKKKRNCVCDQFSRARKL